MKILFLSNFYPPHLIGGYELLCQEVVNALAQRGHAVSVLTSTYGVDQEVHEGSVHRLLRLESDLYFYRPSQACIYPWLRQRNRWHLQQIVAAEQPDIVFVWGMWSLSKQLAAAAEQMSPVHVVYYLANPWPIEPNMHQVFWDAPARSLWSQLVKQAVRLPMRLWLAAEWEQPPLQFEHAPCCSKALRDQLLAAGVPLQDAPIIYEGIDLRAHQAQAAQRRPATAADAPLTLVFVGNVVEHKGVHTTIEALAQLAPEKRRRVHLTILGSGHPNYEARLHRLVETHGLDEQVMFHERIPRPELPAFLGRFDALLLPSIWEEPLALIMQEGLANGLVIIGSATGGTKEIIVDGHNGLLFPAGDAAALARQIELLLDEPALRWSLAQNGQRTANEKFALPRMVNDLEQYLLSVHEGTVSHQPLSAG